MDRLEAKAFMEGMRGIAIEPTYFDLERCSVDAKAVVAMAVRCCANTLRVGMFSHQGHAYYPSEIAPHAPGLDGQDLLGEFQGACRDAGLTLGIYMNSKWDTQRYFEHPDWAIRSGGEVPKHEQEADLQIYPMCPNSPFLDYFQSLLREVAGKYGPEILYIDNFGMNISCDCRFCAEAFREASGQALPAGMDWEDPTWQAYRRWSRERNFVLARRLADAIRSTRPGTLVVFNRGHFRSMTGHGNPEDIHTFAHEIADNVHGESAVRFYGQSFDHIDEQCMFGRAIRTPMWTWVEYPLQPWSHVASPPSEVRIKAVKVLANGGRPMVWNVPRAPDCDGRGLVGLSDVFGLAAQYPEYFDGAEHVPFIGVLYSSRTPGQRTEYPGLLACEFGRGRVLYIPGAFGLMYAERGFPDYRKLMRNAAGWMAHGAFPIRTSLPDTVGVTLTRNVDGALVVHLVNGSADLSRPVERVVPVSGETLRVQLTGPEACRVRALVAGEDLSCSVEDGIADIVLPTLNEYEVVVVEREP